jgi:hypothetical protein
MGPCARVCACRQVVLKHDVSRVVQSCLKHGSREQKDAIVRELQGHFVALTKSPYARHLAVKAMAACANQQRRILSEFRGHTLALLKHKVPTCWTRTTVGRHTGPPLPVALQATCLCEHLCVFWPLSIRTLHAKAVCALTWA